MLQIDNNSFIDEHCTLGILYHCCWTGRVGEREEEDITCYHNDLSNTTYSLKSSLKSVTILNAPFWRRGLLLNYSY